MKLWIVSVFLEVFLSVDGKSIKPQLDGRIIGGSLITIQDIPYQVSLQLRNFHVCGGSLISKEWVISAAHCTEGARNGVFSVRIGSDAYASGGVLVGAKRIIQHPNYNSSTSDYDFSLLLLETWDSSRVTFGTVALPKHGEDVFDGTVLRVSGWGATKTGSGATSLLRYVDVPKYNQRECNRIYRRSGGVTSQMICAGYSRGGKDSCNGDSGGPLARDGKLIGVVSWGAGCALAKYPGVYARVASVRNWIQEVTGV